MRHAPSPTCSPLAARAPKSSLRQARDAAIALYATAAEHAAARGIIIADTKFEFGLDATGTLHLIDEALTPDSSRFWPADAYREGSNPPSYDKQYVRDYLETLAWNKQAPGPHLPPAVLAGTAARYVEACERLTGEKFVLTESAAPAARDPRCTPVDRFRDARW